MAKKSLNYSIDTITLKEAVELIDIIRSADAGYCEYTVEEVNQCLHNLGIADEEGILYPDDKLAYKKETEVQFYLSHIIEIAIS